MSENIHPLAPHALPPFLPGPDGSDYLMTIMAVFLVATVFAFGVLYLHLHSLPERRLHGREKAQFEIVAVLGLLALFTHNHIFWIAALLLGMIHIPDFWTPLTSMAESLRLLVAGKAQPPETRAAPDEDRAKAPAAPAAPAEGRDA